MNSSDEILYLVSKPFSRSFARFKLYSKRKPSVSNACFKISAALSGVSVFNIISAIFTSLQCDSFRAGHKLWGHYVNIGAYTLANLGMPEPPIINQSDRQEHSKRTLFTHLVLFAFRRKVVLETNAISSLTIARLRYL
nr:hypothetical protein GZ18F2_57 [uncultured archaeon GZfos18F2]